MQRASTYSTAISVPAALTSQLITQIPLIIVYASGFNQISSTDTSSSSHHKSESIQSSSTTETSTNFAITTHANANACIHSTGAVEANVAYYLTNNNNSYLLYNDHYNSSYMSSDESVTDDRIDSLYTWNNAVYYELMFFGCFSIVILSLISYVTLKKYSLTEQVALLKRVYEK